MPNRKMRIINSERIKIKRKVRKSFSIPQRQCIGRSNTIKPAIQHIPSQEKNLDETDMCPSTSAENIESIKRVASKDSSTLISNIPTEKEVISSVEKGSHEAGNSMPNRERQIIHREKVNVKRTARKSFSIPKKQSVKRQSTTKPIIVHVRLPEKDSDENMYPSTSAETEPCTVDDVLETDVSIEQIRSSEFMTTEEHLIPYPMVLNDPTDSATFIVNCVHHDGGPISSTPYSLSVKKRKYLNFSEIAESIKRIAPKHSSTMIINIPTEKEEPLAIPDVSYIKGNNEESDSSKNLLTYSEIIAFQGLEISENSDEQKVDEENVECSKNSCFEDDGFSGSFNSSSRRRNYKNEVGNHFEDKDYCNRGDSFGKAQDIHTPKTKGEPYKDVKSLSLKHTHEGGPFEDTDNNKRRGSVREALNIQTDIPKKKRRRHRSVLLKPNTSKKATDSLSRSKNSADHSRLTYTEGSEHRRKYVDEVGNSVENRINYNTKDNFESAQNIQIDTPKKTRHLHRGVGSVRRKLTDKGGSSFEDINQCYAQDRFENVQNIQNGELQENEFENYRSKTQSGSSRQRLANKEVGHNTSRLSTYNHQMIKLVNEGEKSFGNTNENNRRDRIQATQTIHTAVPKKKSTSFRGIAYKIKRRLNTSKNTPKSLGRSRNSTDLTFIADVQDNQKEEKKSHWPLCCLMYAQKREFHILKPVIRHDLPIDDITLMSLGKNSKKECKH